MVDLGVVLEHGAHVAQDALEPVGVVVADADGLVDAAVAHARGVLDRDLGEGGVGHVERALVEGADRGQAPADALHHALDVAVRRADPVADGEGAVEIDHEPAEEVGEQVLGREAHGQPPDAAEGEHARDAVAERLQRDERAGDDDRGAQQLADGVRRGAVDLAPLRLGRGDEVGLGAPDEAQQEPDDDGDDGHVAHRADRLEDGRARGALHHGGGEGDADHPDQPGERGAERLDDGVVPGRAGALEAPLQAQPQPPLHEVEQERGEDDEKDLGDPGALAAEDVEPGGEVRQFHLGSRQLACRSLRSGAMGTHAANRQL